MLDRETKSKIDNCRNILLGKISDPISQVKQITIGLIYKFMDDMDKESVKMGGIPAYFVGDFEKYSWNNIFNPRIGGEEMIILYGDGIEKMNQNTNLEPFLRDIFKDAYLPFRDPSTLKLFLKEIDWFHYSHSEKLGDAFEYLLSILSSQGDAGQFRTPRHIIDFLVEIIKPKKTERINDPACGTSGFLISSYKHILRNNTKKNLGDLITPDERSKLVENIIGYDISPDMVRLSLVNLLLHQFSNPKIYEYDTLTSEDKWNEYFDVILANPPFMSPMGGIRPHKRFSIESNRAEVLFVDYIMEHLTPKGRSGIVVPEGIIFQSGKAYKSLRKTLVEKYLVGVISLPSGIFQPYSGVKTSILILDKELSPRTDKIFFGKVDNDGYDLGAQRREIEKNDLPVLEKEITEYLEGLRKGKVIESEKLTYVPKEQILGSSDFGLSYDRYTVQSHSTSTFNYVKLGSITSLITKGTTPTSVGYEFVEEGINFVKIESISIDGLIKREKFNYITKECNNSLKRSILEENDILFSIAGALGRTYVVEKNILPANTNQALSIIRLNKNINPYYVSYILRSDIVKKMILGLKVGVAQMNISLEQVKNIEIPLPPIEVQQEIVGELEQYQKIIDGAKQVVDYYKPFIDVDPIWELRRLDEIGKVCMCKRIFKEQTNIKGDVPFYKIGTFGGNPDSFIDVELFNEFKSKYPYPKKGDILISTSGTIGKIVEFDGLPAYFQDSNIVWITNNEEIVSNQFLKIYYQIIKWRPTEGVTIARLYNKNIEETIIPVPPLEIQKSIVERIESERQIIEGNKKLIEIYSKKIQDRINKIWGE
jgi:type I restriction enzyme M protein